jgi:hypothetical protein
LKNKNSKAWLELKNKSLQREIPQPGMRKSVLENSFLRWLVR